MIDLTFLNQFARGNSDKMKRYIHLYLQVAPDTFNRMQRSLEKEEWSNVAVHAHALKPQADFMGNTDLKETLVAIENAVREGTTDEIGGLCRKALVLHKEGERELIDKLEQL